MVVGSVGGWVPQITPAIPPPPNGQRNPPPMEKQKRRTKTAAWWTFTEGKGREGQRMAICQWAPPAAEREHKTMASCQTPPPPVKKSPWGGGGSGPRYVRPPVLRADGVWPKAHPSVVSCIGAVAAI